MSIAFLSAGHSTSRYEPDPAISMSSSTSSRWLIGCAPPTLKKSPFESSEAPARRNASGGIVDIDEVAQLLPVAEDLDLIALDGQPDEPADEALPIVTEQLTGTVDVGQAQRARAHAEDVVVDQVIELAGHLVDAVDIGGANEMVLVDRQARRLAVDLPGAGEHDFGRAGCSAGTPRARSTGCGS